MTRRTAGQEGTLALSQAAVLCVFVVLAGVATVEAAGLLRAARVAGAAADGGALAAVTASQPGGTVAPRGAAEQVVRAHGAGLVACRCGGPRAHVRVVLALDSRLLAAVGITEVHAEADAALVPDRRRARPQPSSGSLVDPRGAATATPHVDQGARHVEHPRSAGAG